MTEPRIDPSPSPAGPRPRRAWIVLAAVLGVVLALGIYLWRHQAPPPATSVPPTPEIQAVLDQVERYIAEKRYEDGLKVARDYLGEHPEAPYIHFAIGWLLASMREYKDAIPEFEAELAKNPNHIRSLNSIGVSYSSLGEIEKGIPFAERSLKLEPNQPRVALVVGKHLASTGRIDEAEKLLDVAAKAEGPMVGDANFELAMIYLRRNERERAMEALRRALAVDSGHLAALYNLGQTLKRAGQVVEGDQLLARHVRLTKEYDEIEAVALRVEMPGRTARDFADFGEVHVRHKQYPQAAAAYQRAVAMEPSEPRWLQALASIQVELGNLSEADRLARRTLELSPGNPAALFLLGNIRIREGRATEANEIFKQSQARGDWSAQTYLQLGITLIRTRSFEGARNALQHATTLDPQNGNLYYWLSVSWLKTGHPAEAAAILQNAIRLEPDNDDYAMALGVVRFLQGDRNGAAESFRRAIHLQRATLFGEPNVELMLEKYRGAPENQEALKLYRELRAAETSPSAAGSPGALAGTQTPPAE